MTAIPVSTLDVFGDDFLADPYAYHAELRDVGPVVLLDRYGAYAMARHTEVSAALRNFETFCSGRGVGLSNFAHETPWRPPSLLLETDPPVHQRTRKLMNKVVSIRAIRELSELWRARARELVTAALAKGRINAVTEIAEAYPMMIFPDTIGLPMAGRDNLLVYAAASFNAFGPRNALFFETTKMAEQAVQWVAEACERSHLSDDGWGMAVYRAADAGECTEAEAALLVRSFLSAGIDTTVNGIGNMIAAFAENPDQWRLLRANPSLIKRAFEESLRWDSTVQLFFRTTTRPVDVAGQTIPEDAKVLLFLAAANRDPRRWVEPDRFDITRTASSHVAFGFGIHQCLGQMVARAEAEQLLTALLERVSEIRLLSKPVRRINNTLRAMAEVHVELIPA